MTTKTVCPIVTTACFLLVVCSQFSEAYIGTPASKTVSLKQRIPFVPVAEDTTRIGNLIVPTVGVGTISWSSNSILDTENEDIDGVVSMAYRSNAAFFDTAERYGTHWKTAFGMGYGETERMTSKYIQKATEEDASKLKPVVATKFTPIPWRTTVQSVVDACEESCRNLGVDQIDLYQIHMPDSKL
jgi:aryl-alcohol dehydrogenase-like predicted oxidoreductase